MTEGSTTMCHDACHLNRIGIGIIGATIIGASAVLAAQQPPSCAAAPQSVARLPALPEASGLAISRTTSGRLWTHNDSGAPALFALNAQGALTARVRLSGLRVNDWEALAAGRCPAGSCLFIGDIGDNDSARRQISVYRLAEPGASEGATPEAFHATYPDGRHNAETLLIDSQGRLYLITKEETRPPRLYRFPAELKAGATHSLEPVKLSGTAAATFTRISDGSVSPDGQWAALRNDQQVAFFKAQDFFAGRWSPARTVDITGVGEPQGEGLAIADDGTLYLAGEGAGESAPGTFARVACLPAQPLR